ncbi:hypothetical protein BTUL_0459g00020 [Botrytis tulipae]|uniref:Uncharacterized protein n=1 Tax=Botrytis tulipae TaxID=87230 RepID=A0A4Z1E7W4_9HELO|nr:hypothetical protein BTUL_0459g00020 [Botrytis tulipae]
MLLVRIWKYWSDKKCDQFNEKKSTMRLWTRARMARGKGEAKRETKSKTLIILPNDDTAEKTCHYLHIAALAM